MNASFKLGPLVHWALSDVTVAVLGNNVTPRQNSAPYIHFCHVEDKGLRCDKASSNFVLVLSYHGGTSRANFAAHIHAYTTGYDYTIFVELKISVGAAPRKTDVVPFAIVKTNSRISVEKENILLVR